MRPKKGLAETQSNGSVIVDRLSEGEWDLEVPSTIEYLAETTAVRVVADSTIFVDIALHRGAQLWIRSIPRSERWIELEIEPRDPNRKLPFGLKRSWRFQGDAVKAPMQCGPIPPGLWTVKVRTVTGYRFLDLELAGGEAFDVDVTEDAIRPASR